MKNCSCWYSQSKKSFNILNRTSNTVFLSIHPGHYICVVLHFLCAMFFLKTMLIGSGYLFPRLVITKYRDTCSTLRIFATSAHCLYYLSSANHTHTYVCTHTYTHEYIYTCVYTHTCVHIYTNTFSF